MKIILKVGSFLLVGSAFLSKILGLLRDRLFIENFAENGQTDYIFAAFRIPDFFFFLLIGGTVSTLFLPRIVDLKSEEKWKFVSSFFWGIVSFFGIFCILGTIFPKFFVSIFASGLTEIAKSEVANLVRYLFGSVFLLAVSSVFSAAEQAQEKFFSIALAPIIYTASICLGTYFFTETLGLNAIGFSAVLGALLHLLVNFISHLSHGGRVGFFWQSPPQAWKGFFKDFSFRTVNNAAFQINQSADIWIASFLVAGSISAYQIGANLGMALLSILGLPIARAVFPQLTKHKKNFAKQKIILVKYLKIIFLLTIPATFIGFLGAEFWLKILFDLEGDILRMSVVVFKWIVLSLPLATIIPLLSRVYLANDDVLTPMKVSVISLFIATTTAAILALKVFSPEKGVLGLAIGTFLANFISALYFAFLIWKKRNYKNNKQTSFYSSEGNEYL